MLPRFHTTTPGRGFPLVIQAAFTVPLTAAAVNGARFTVPCANLHITNGLCSAAGWAARAFRRYAKQKKNHDNQKRYKNNKFVYV